VGRTKGVLHQFQLDKQQQAKYKSSALIYKFTSGLPGRKQQ